jgi:hypothetical protein
MTAWQFDGINVEFVTTPQVGMTLGETYEVEMVLTEEADYVAIRDYARYATKHADTGTGINGRPFFSEQLPANAQVSSVVVPVKPGADLRVEYGDVMRGVWGVVESFEDSTPPSSQEPFVLTVELFVLGYVDNDGTSSDPDFYASRSEVETALGQPFEVESV